MHNPTWTLILIQLAPVHVRKSHFACLLHLGQAARLCCAVCRAGDLADVRRQHGGVQLSGGHVEHRRHPVHPAIGLLALRCARYLRCCRPKACVRRLLLARSATGYFDTSEQKFHRWRLYADDDVDAVLFEKIRSGEYDADDPIWDSISEQVQRLTELCRHFVEGQFEVVALTR